MVLQMQGDFQSCTVAPACGFLEEAVMVLQMLYMTTETRCACLSQRMVPPRPGAGEHSHQRLQGEVASAGSSAEKGHAASYQASQVGEAGVPLVIGTDACSYGFRCQHVRGVLKTPMRRKIAFNLTVRV